MKEYSRYVTSLVMDSFGKTLILGHVNPDADCLGSAFALAEILRGMGKEADVCTPTAPAERLAFMSEGCLTAETVDADKYDTVISVDVASPAQLGELAVYLSRISLMIDHHGVGEAFADHLIDPTAAASGEIVYDLYRELLLTGKIRKNPRVLRMLYAAISADTGSFKFSNTTPHTLAVASEISAGILSANDGGLDTADICRLLFGRFTEREMKAKMVAISNMRLLENGKLGAVLFSKDILAENGLSEDDIGNAVDTPRCIDGVLVALAIRQVSEKGYRVSSRANGDIDCAAVCAKFGGGGHVRAAGCSLDADTPEDAFAVITEAFAVAVREYLASHPETKARI